MWKEITGHKREKEQLKRAISSKNIPHAYIFSGIEGIGKKKTARLFAKALLCKNPVDGINPCEKCSSCKKSGTDNNPDFIEVIPKNNNITISEIRGIKERMKFAPYEGERRVIIIDNAELLNTNAQNAALKILEEPPKGNHFILITSVASQLLPTIISRCQTIQFSPLNKNEVTEYLISKENYDRDQAETSFSVSGGSLKRALEITPELIDSVTDEFYQAIIKRSASEIIDLSNKWSGLKDDIGKILYILHQIFHNALIKGLGIEDKNNFSEIISYLISKNTTDQLVDKCQILDKSHNYLSRTFNKQLMFEQLLFRLAA